MKEESKNTCNEGNCGHFPFQEIPAMMKAIGHHFRNFGQQNRNWIPYNLQDNGDYYVIMVPLPGRAKEDVKVSLIDNSLNISAKKPKMDAGENKQEESEEIGNKKEILKNFFTFVKVNFDISLPNDANQEEIKPKMANGLLTIKIGKKPPRTINIDGDDENK